MTPVTVTPDPWADDDRRWLANPGLPWHPVTNPVTFVERRTRPRCPTGCGCDRVVAA